jgi:hypothetical protein
MIADASERYTAFPVWLHVYVQDVDAAYKKALVTGGVSVQEPARREGDPDRRGGVEDAEIPGGFRRRVVHANRRAYCLPARCSRRFELSATPSGTLIAA